MSDSLCLVRSERMFHVYKEAEVNFYELSLFHNHEFFINKGHPIKGCYM